MQEPVTNTEHLSVMLCYFANGNNFEGLKFIRVTSQTTVITLLETCLLLDRQTVTETTLHNTVHRLVNGYCTVLSTECSVDTVQYGPQTIRCVRDRTIKSNLTQYIVQPFDIESRRPGRTVTEMQLSRVFS